MGTELLSLANTDLVGGLSKAVVLAALVTRRPCGDSCSPLSWPPCLLLEAVRPSSRPAMTLPSMASCSCCKQLFHGKTFLNPLDSEAA